MGEFLRMSAVRDRPGDRVAGAFDTYASEHGTAATGPAASVDVVTFVEPVGSRWTIVCWPWMFDGANPAARWISGVLGTEVSTIDIYDGDLWRHVLCSRAGVVDRFMSDRLYFGREDDPGERWNGDAGAVARTLGLDAGRLTAYLAPPPRSGRAWPDDEFALEDPWVCVDFWRRLGIPYPEANDPVTATLAFDVALDRALPGEGTDF